VVGLDDGGGTLEGNALDHVGIEGALPEELRPGDLPRRLLEDADEQLSDDLPFPLGVLDPLQRGEEPVLGVHVFEPQADGVPERADDLLRLPFPQQTVVDEDAREPIADRPMEKNGRDGGVDPA